MPELVINVSNIISSLCYSLIRLEPYTTCVHDCVYCYAKWYREGSNIVLPRSRAIREFRALARKVYQKGLTPIPARLSTLVDPFIPHEELYRTSLTMLRIALDYEYPIIINTKATLILKKPWRDVIEKLTDRGLLLLQVSISTMDPHTARILEPYAPSPHLRLSMLREFSSRGIPTVIRLSPYIPRLSLRPSLNEVVEILSEIGVKHVIVEVLRLESHTIEAFLRRLGLELEVESYSLHRVEGRTPLSKISLRARLTEYIALAKALAKRSIAFATCKEGLFALHTARDCCGMYLFRRAIAYRPTLAEFYNIARERGGIPLDRLGHIIEELEKHGYLCGSRLSLYPKRIAKPLKYHEKKLLRIAQKRELVMHVTPLLDIVEGKLIARDIQL